MNYQVDIRKTWVLNADTSRESGLNWSVIKIDEHFMEILNRAFDTYKDFRD